MTKEEKAIIKKMQNKIDELKSYQIYQSGQIGGLINLVYLLEKEIDNFKNSENE